MGISQAAIDALTESGAERGVDLRPGMSLVEQRLQATVAHDLPILQEASRHLMDAGGKRFRPLLVLLAGLVGGSRVTDDALVDAGVIVELVHLSTLYHDDVIDDADARRGVPTAHEKWSNTVAILTGDFLLARASELSAALGVEVTRIMARTITDLCAGQIREVQGSLAARDSGIRPVVGDRAYYLRVLSEKTASLIATSARLGGLLSGLPRESVEALRNYGYHLGLSFQLADDLLDITSEAGDTGKEPGTDLREGVRTMPILYALEAEGPASELATWVADPTEDHAAAALALLRAHPAMQTARDEARLEAAKARRALRAFDDGTADPIVLEALADLTEYAATRAG